MRYSVFCNELNCKYLFDDRKSRIYEYSYNIVSVRLHRMPGHAIISVHVHGVTLLLFLGHSWILFISVKCKRSVFPSQSRQAASELSRGIDFIWNNRWHLVDMYHITQHRQPIPKIYVRLCSLFLESHPIGCRIPMPLPMFKQFTFLAAIE